MKKSKLPDGVTISPVTADDIRSFYGRDSNSTMKAWGFHLHGELVAVAGFVRDVAGLTLFSDIMPGLEVSKLTRWKAIKHFMELVDECKQPYYSAPDNEIGSSFRLLKRLGFEDTGRRHNGFAIYWRDAT